MSEAAEPLLGSNSATITDSREEGESEFESELPLSGKNEASPDRPRSAQEYFCGCGPCHPPWLQWLRDARVFTTLLCLFSTIEGALVSGTQWHRSTIDIINELMVAKWRKVGDFVC